MKDNKQGSARDTVDLVVMEHTGSHVAARDVWEKDQNAIH